MFTALLPPSISHCLLQRPGPSKSASTPSDFFLSGATKGIGRAIVLELATRGASILGTYTTPSSSHLFDTLSDSITTLYSPTSHFPASSPSRSTPKLVGIAADITSPTAPSIILDALRTHFDDKVDIVVLNAAVMGLAKMGEGVLDAEWVDRSMAGNVRFPVLLMEGLVGGGHLRQNGRVVAVSSEGVRARRPGGG